MHHGVRAGGGGEHRVRVAQVGTYEVGAGQEMGRVVTGAVDQPVHHGDVVAEVEEVAGGGGADVTGTAEQHDAHGIVLVS